jgi:hypothetical protein
MRGQASQEKAMQSPAASIFYSQITSAVGAPEAVVDGRTKEAKAAGPAQNPDTSFKGAGGSVAPTNSQFLNSLIKGSRDHAIKIPAINMRTAASVLNGGREGDAE